MRLHLFEWEDQSWFPDQIRQGMMDFLGFALRRLRYYNAAVPLLDAALEDTDGQEVVDFCSGNGSPVMQICHQTARLRGVKFYLSDRYPQTVAWARAREQSQGRVRFFPQPVDALAPDPALPAFGTCFSALHHFRPEQVRALLQQNITQRRALAVFDGGNRGLFPMLAILLGQPLLFLLGTPFIRPFRWSRLIFTYLVPLIPLCTIWDGLVSMLRLYTPAQLLELARTADPERQYEWKAGTRPAGLIFRMAYLIGVPKKKGS
jgi:hypothetical protein